MPAAPYGPFPRPHRRNRLPLVGAHVPEADFREAHLASHQDPEGLHRLWMADDFVELGRRQERVAILGLPDAVFIPVTAVVPSVPVESFHKAGDLVVSQDPAKRQVAVLLEEIVIFLSHWGFPPSEDLGFH